MELTFLESFESFSVSEVLPFCTNLGSRIWLDAIHDAMRIDLEIPGYLHTRFIVSISCMRCFGRHRLHSKLWRGYLGLQCQY